MNPFEVEVHLRHVREEQERAAVRAQRVAAAQTAMRALTKGVGVLRARSAPALEPETGETPPTHPALNRTPPDPTT